MTLDHDGPQSLCILYVKTVNLLLFFIKSFIVDTDLVNCQILLRILLSLFMVLKLHLGTPYYYFRYKAITMHYFIYFSFLCSIVCFITLTI
jgi:hypothetical protein